MSIAYLFAFCIRIWCVYVLICCLHQHFSTSLLPTLIANNAPMQDDVQRASELTESKLQLCEYEYLHEYARYELVVLVVLML